MLGYSKDIRFSKICDNYYLEYKGYEAVVTIVEVPELNPDFVELEIQVDSTKHTDDALCTLHDLLKNLGIPKSDLTNIYYTDMVRESRTG